MVCEAEVGQWARGEGRGRSERRRRGQSGGRACGIACRGQPCATRRRRAALLRRGGGCTAATTATHPREEAAACVRLLALGLSQSREELVEAVEVTLALLCVVHPTEDHDAALLKKVRVDLPAKQLACRGVEAEANALAEARRVVIARSACLRPAWRHTRMVGTHTEKKQVGLAVGA